MGLLDLIRGVSEIQQQTGAVKNTRQQIFGIRDRLRNTPQFSEIFYNIVSDPSHPPMQIVIDYTQGGFLSMDWDLRTGNYEPYTTVKYTDPNIAYAEGCAIFLLIQECYPDVYDFPNRTVTQVAEGVPLELNMKKQFVTKQLIPASTPKQFSVPAPQAAPAAQTSAPSFCSNCGAKLEAPVRFCPSCGAKIG